MATPAASKWVRVTKYNRCPVCDKPDWCLVSENGKASICARIESDRPAGNKGAGWIHRPDTAKTFPALKPRTEVKQTPKAASDLLDMAYRALLQELSLSETHHENLKHRGLTDSEIHTLEYKTLPANERHQSVKCQCVGLYVVGTKVSEKNIPIEEVS